MPRTPEASPGSQASGDAVALECGASPRFFSAVFNRPVPLEREAANQKRRNAAHSRGFARFAGFRRRGSVWSAAHPAAFSSAVLIGRCLEREAAYQKRGYAAHSRGFARFADFRRRALSFGVRRIPPLFLCRL